MSDLEVDPSLVSSNPESWLHAVGQREDLLCIVFFRGPWCKYDEYYLKSLGKHHMTTMKKEKVKMIAWTSQGSASAAEADEKWALKKDFGYDEVIGDDTCALAKYLIEDEILPDLKIATQEEANAKDLVNDLKAYPNGIVMPAMVWYAHHGSLVSTWTSKCEADNNFGGLNRPEPVDLYAKVLKRKHALDSGSAVMPIHNFVMCTTKEQVD